MELEKVGMHHIRLALPRECASARVATFFAADQVLRSWAARTQGTLECEFEIVYHDGQTLAGEYRQRIRTNSRPALTAFVRKTLRLLCEGNCREPPVRGLINGPHNFLAHYETEDFASTPGTNPKGDTT